VGVCDAGGAGGLAQAQVFAPWLGWRVPRGSNGLVCSAEEVAAVRQAMGPEALLVVPGIRARARRRATRAG